MIFRAGRVAIPMPRILPLATAFGFFLALIGYAVWTRQPGLPFVHIAFIGNSMMYYNDFPRLMERLGDGHISQDSCLHGDADLSTILRWGSGTYLLFSTGTARVGLSDRTQYDFGACTVPQLLFGYDANLEQKMEEFGNYGDDDTSLAESTAYDDYLSFYDGTNPCLRHENYYEYLENKFEGDGVPNWDYVVINDNTRSPARSETREESLEALKTYYVPWLLEVGATPVLIATYGYWSPYRDMSGLADVPTFTSLTYEGYLQYTKLLEEELPESQKPRVAKVGLAFLMVWEENREMWNNLFHIDKIHASPAGTYLQAVVVYHTVFGEMAPRAIALRPDTSSMWDYARRFAPPNQRRGRFPTPDEVVYLYNIAVRVCVYGVIPTSLTLYGNGEAVSYTAQDDLYRLDDLF